MTEATADMLLGVGFAPLDVVDMANFFEVPEELVRDYPEFFCKLFYLYKTTGSSKYLALSLLPENVEVRKMIDKEFSEFVRTIGPDTITELHYLTRDEVRGDAFVDAVRQKVGKGKEVIAIKSEEETGLFSYSIVVVPSDVDIEVIAEEVM